MPGSISEQGGGKSSRLASGRRLLLGGPGRLDDLQGMGQRRASI